MNYIVLALVGVVGVWLGLYLARKRSASGAVGINEERSAQKEERKEAIFAHIQKQSRVTNDEVQKMFDVSDATATRYLQELEEEKRVVQVGAEGQSVYYQLARTAQSYD